MIAYYRSRDVSKCCGCRACELSCHRKAISMCANDEGFLYPSIDKDKCIDCGICEAVCPMENNQQQYYPLSVYGLQHKKEDILEKSSSGGAFRVLADQVISEGGCVIGCVWDKQFHPVLRVAESFDELLPMQGSKYLYSDPENVFVQVKERLQLGQLVLFTGTPCQCAGLLSFLRKPYDNLITADFLCHGVPSQQIFDAYLDNIIKNIRKKDIFKKAEITEYQFRDKKKRGWGHVSSYTWTCGEKGFKKYLVATTDPYDYGFLLGYFNRYSCYSCRFQGENKSTDFTFCDYWGVERYHKEFLYEKGVSAISVNTPKAELFQNRVKNSAIWIKTRIECVAEDNPTIKNSVIEEIPVIRKSIYKELRTRGWKYIEKKYLHVRNRNLKCIWYALPLTWTKKVKRLINKKG